MILDLQTHFGPVYTLEKSRLIELVLCIESEYIGIQ